MRTFIRTLIAGVGAVALAATVSAAQPAGKPAAQKSAVKPAAAKTMAKSATGKIAKYDSATRMLTVSTSKGEESFVIADKASLHAGPKVLAADDLVTHAGETVKIRYTDAGGKMTAETVTVAAPPKKSAKKTGK